MIDAPIFIGGVSFSGKTQLRLLLNRHSNILITRHTYFWRKFYGKYGDLNRRENLERCLDDVLTSKQALTLNPNLQTIAMELSQGPADYSRLFCLIHEQHARAAGKGRWGIQQSFVESDADLLFREMPDARILHVIRSPFERIEESAANSPRKPGKIGAETALWRLSARWASRNARSYPDRYMLVHWEALLEKPEAVLRDVCSFISVDYEPAMLSAVDFNASQPNGHRKLSRSEQSVIQALAGREMAQLGYLPQRKPLSAGDILSLALFDFPVNSSAQLIAGMTVKYPSPPNDNRSKGDNP